MVVVIVFSALIAGAKTFPYLDPYENLFVYLDYLITAIFLFELLIRFVGEDDKANFFKNGWNLFDAAIVIISLIPIANSDMVVVGRMLRIFRIMRVVSFIPELRLLVTSFFNVMPKLFYILVLLFIFFYIYGTIGSTLFGPINPDLWGDVAVSMLTLFRVMTLEAWTDVMYETMEVYPMSWAFYLSFIIITAFAFLNLLIGVIVNVIDNETSKDLKLDDERDARERELVNGIKVLEKRLKEYMEK